MSRFTHQHKIAVYSAPIYPNFETKKPAIYPNFETKNPSIYPNFETKVLFLQLKINVLQK